MPSFGLLDKLPLALEDFIEVSGVDLESGLRRVLSLAASFCFQLHCMLSLKKFTQSSHNAFDAIRAGPSMLAQ